MEPSDIPDTTATVLYVGNLDKRVTDIMMLDILKTGLDHCKDKILSVNMFPSYVNPGTQEGFCFVQFEDNGTACVAMNFLNGREFYGKKVKVNWATNSPCGMPKVIGTSVSIYVGNLDDDIDENDLRLAFSAFGEILFRKKSMAYMLAKTSEDVWQSRENVKVVRDPVTNQSKNIAFISFSNKPDAEKAIRDMHGAMLKKRPIKTNWATRNQNQKKEEHDYHEVLKAASAENRTVYAGGIPSNCTDEEVRNHFSGHGEIVDIRIFAVKNYAFIKFDTHENAATAICKTNGTELNGCCLKCWWGKDGADGQSGSYNPHSNYSYSGMSSNYQPQHQSHPQHDQHQYSQMTPQQQQQYMQYMCHPYYQQQYYQYWMQHYQQQMQQNGGQQSQGCYQQQQGYQPRGQYPQQQYNQQNYQS